MKKTTKIFLLFAIILIYINFCASSVCFATDDLQIFSETAILIEQSTGKILYKKDAYKRMYPASTTKILTCIIALEECDLNETAVASEEAISRLEEGYTKANIVPGEEFTIKQLLLLMQLQSANEAANIIAEHISGGIEEFAKLMNKRAKEMGCIGSNFVNPNGMHDENHYSTAYDLAQIARYCMQNDTYREIVLTPKCDIPDTDIWNNYKIEMGREDEPYREFYNTNRLLKEDDEYYYPYCTGGKTGFTTPAKNCFVATSNKDGFELVSVIMHAELTDDEKSARYVDTINLFNYGYDNYNLEEIQEEYKEVKKTNIKSSNNKTNLQENSNDKDISSALILVGAGSVILIVGIIILKKCNKK